MVNERENVAIEEGATGPETFAGSDGNWHTPQAGMYFPVVCIGRYKVLSLRLALVGPDPETHCGIAEYTCALRRELEQVCDTKFFPYQAITDFLQSSTDLNTFDAILVQYERSLLPTPRFLETLGARYPSKVFVVPHEVHAIDPYSFPPHQLSSAWPAILWLKRLKWRLLHRERLHEEALMAKGYGVRGVLPLSPPNAEVLRGMGAGNLLPMVPLARPQLPDLMERAPAKRWFGRRPELVAGVFGFLNEANDYQLLLDALRECGLDAAALLVGGKRDGGSGTEGWERALEKSGGAGVWNERAVMTGYLEEPELSQALSACDIFICPFRFRSNSASVLRMAATGRLVLAADIPLTRWLASEGLPIVLFHGPVELAICLREAAEGKIELPADGYRWSFSEVARRYIDILCTELGR